MQRMLLPFSWHSSNLQNVCKCVSLCYLVKSRTVRFVMICHDQPLFLDHIRHFRSFGMSFHWSRLRQGFTECPKLDKAFRHVTTRYFYYQVHMVHMVHRVHMVHMVHLFKANEAVPSGRWAEAVHCPAFAACGGRLDSAACSIQRSVALAKKKRHCRCHWRQLWLQLLHLLRVFILEQHAGVPQLSFVKLATWSLRKGERNPEVFGIPLPPVRWWREVPLASCRCIMQHVQLMFYISRLLKS